MTDKTMINIEIMINRQWKSSLKSLYELGALTVTSDESNEAIEYLFKRFPELGKKLSLFMNSNKLKIEGDIFKDRTVHETIILAAQTLIKRLDELSLVQKRKSGAYNVVGVSSTLHGAPIYVYSLNERGLDTVLKLIEHDDNNERFNTQMRISNHLKINSTISVAVSIIALCIAMYGAALSFKRLTILENSLIDKPKTEQTQPVEKTPVQPKESNADTNQ